MAKGLIIVLIGLLGLGFALWDHYAPPRAPHITVVDGSLAVTPVQKPAPDFTITDINGTTHDLSAYRGKTVLLNIWATWCPPCVIELPQMIALAAAEHERLVLIALSVDESEDDIRALLARLDAQTQEQIAGDAVIIARDEDAAISRDLYGTTRYPETYIITPDGTIKQRVQGLVDWNSTAIRAKVFE